MDSLKIGYRSGGAQLDSIDASFIGNYHLRPGGGYRHLHDRHLAGNTYVSAAGFSYLTTQQKVTPKFTVLPYLAFRYAFQSSMTQDLDLEDHPFFRPQTHIR